MRSASSEKRAQGSPTARINLAPMSRRPPIGSISPFDGDQAMALTVKSRRARSSRRLRRKPDGLGPPVVQVFAVNPEGGDFNRHSARYQGHRAVGSAGGHDALAGEHALNLIGQRADVAKS